MPHSLMLPLSGARNNRALLEREWLVTNGLGGFASGSVLGPATRRYHGLFVPNLSEPKGRHVVVSRLDDCIEVDGEELALSFVEHVEGDLPRDAHAHLSGFRVDGLTPVWRFQVAGRVIERSVVMPHGRNAVCVRWRLLEGAACTLRVRPYASGRRLDAPLQLDERTPFALDSAAGGGLWLRMTDGGIALRLQVHPEQTAFAVEPTIDHDVLMRTERDRGYDHHEHQHSPGFWTFALAPGAEAAWFASTGDDAPPLDAAALFAAEDERLADLLQRADIDASDAVEARLTLAADQFIVRPGSRRDDVRAAGAHPEEFRSVFAGYHWFCDWGRDTMISLEGLTLATGRPREARAVLHTFASYIHDGLLPNLFPEGAREALYHTVDATLWYFHALDRYLQRSGDAGLVAELYPVLRDVVGHHLRGTHYGIGVDPDDGLLRAAADGYQLTWMDAKVDGWVVTPRRGKPVEIQALWFNALCLMARWSRLQGSPADAPAYEEKAARVRRSFAERFWSPARGHLLDVVDGPDGDDGRLRPNQVFALSLAHPVLDGPRAAMVLDRVAGELLTPVGLRTLGPREADYQPHYRGALRERDAAYHQGTVWPWLLGHFVDAWLRIRGPGPQARTLLEPLQQHLVDAGIGSVSEVFDAQEPHRPGGCIAQAWSVAELLRAWQATRPKAGTHG